MAGLLYRNFCIIRGKKLLLTLLVLTLAFLLLRLLFPADTSNPMFTAVTEDGSKVALTDTFLLLAPSCLLLASVSLLFQLPARILQASSPGTISIYTSSLPLSDETILASNYLFLGINAYVLLSLNFIWQIIFLAFSQENTPMNLLCTSEQLFMLPLFNLALLSFSIEMPLTLQTGTENTRRIKIVCVMLLAFLLIGILLFVNPVNLEHSLNSMAAWITSHEITLMLISEFSTVIVLLLCYISYRISSKILLKKKVQDFTAF